MSFARPRRAATPGAPVRRPGPGSAATPSPGASPAVASPSAGSLAVAGLALFWAAGTALPSPADAQPRSSFDPGRASFSVGYRDLEIPYRVFLLAAMPGEPVTIRVTRERAPPGGGGRDADAPGASGREPEDAPYTLHAGGGEVAATGERSWRWTAPAEPGRRHRLVVRRGARGDSVVLNAFVLVPARRMAGGRLEGYRLGSFPTPAYRGLPQYRPPRGYLRLTRTLASVPVSPHFTLGQFPCRRPTGYPKYLLVGPKMLLKLERMLQELNRRGIRAEGFRVMSAYRSPWYNTQLLGRPRYSRHIYGDAADVFVDADGDGYMDDLNGDGRITVGDADVLFRIADRIDRQGGGNPLTGGLWKYRKTARHPPFVHVDTRGFVAR